jgi:hypothetical protein
MIAGFLVRVRRWQYSKLSADWRDCGSCARGPRSSVAVCGPSPARSPQHVLHHVRRSRGWGLCCTSNSTGLTCTDWHWRLHAHLDAHLDVDSRPRSLRQRDVVVVLFDPPPTCSTLLYLPPPTTYPHIFSTHPHPLSDTSPKHRPSCQHPHSTPAPTRGSAQAHFFVLPRRLQGLSRVRFGCAQGCSSHAVY